MDPYEAELAGNLLLKDEAFWSLRNLNCDDFVKIDVTSKFLQQKLGKRGSVATKKMTNHSRVGWAAEGQRWSELKQSVIVQYKKNKSSETIEMKNTSSSIKRWTSSTALSYSNSVLYSSIQTSNI